jgi:hypothetical protein
VFLMIAVKIAELGACPAVGVLSAFEGA